MKQYKEIKIEDISEIELGDIVFYMDGTLGFVFKKGKTFLHNHNFIEVHTNYINTWNPCTDKWYSEDIDNSEIILRSISRIKHDGLLGLGEQQ